MNQFPDSWPLPQRRVYQGQFVTLRPIQATLDTAELFAATHGAPEIEAMWRYLPYGPFGGEAALQAWLTNCEAATPECFFAVVSHETQKPVGSLAIMSVEPLHGRAEIGHVWYSPAVQRTKVNTESVFLLLKHLFDDLHYRRVEWKCNDRNEPSKRAARRMGFQPEGLFRQHQIVKGENRDTAWFSMLDSEWPPRRANFQRWLYEDDSVSLSQLNS